MMPVSVARQEPLVVVWKIGKRNAHVRVPSMGDVVSSRSLPYKQRPASKRNESRAPRPTGITSGLSRRVDLFNDEAVSWHARWSRRLCIPGPRREYQRESELR